MNNLLLHEWLNEPRTALVRAVADGVREDVAGLRSSGSEFYGYALAPGDLSDISGIVAVTNGAAKILVPPHDRLYRYYRYCVDEWKDWRHDGFASANRLLAELNAQFRSLHSKDADDFWLDEYEVAHAEALLHATVLGLDAAKREGAFGDDPPFLVVWISDSDHPVMWESARRLNSPHVISEFEAEFGRS